MMEQFLDFNIYAIICGVLMLTSLVLFRMKSKTSKVIANVTLSLSLILLIVYTIVLWVELQRPPFRTLGETRLWYSIFLGIIGYFLYLRWNQYWILLYSIMMTLVFVMINYLNPETFDKSLMPALQSPWFIPHVVVYIIGYAFLAMSSLIGMLGLYNIWMQKSNKEVMKLADNTVYIGFAFLTFGLLFGALWAKEAWGHYWTWDPKETWALLTWLVYLIYIHFRFHKNKHIKPALWVLAIAFIVLIICWFGMSYLPTAQNSVHVYSS